MTKTFAAPQKGCKMIKTLSRQSKKMASGDFNTIATSTDNEKAAKAFRTVLGFMISDAFALSTEESLWVRSHLNETLSPLGNMTPTCLPIAVRIELREKSYSKAQNSSDLRVLPSMALMYDRKTTSASLADWTGVLVDTLNNCYSFRPMIESVVYGQINSILREIGIGDPINPRGSRYLPNAVKSRLHT
jgi:hypothetical protein